MPDGWFTPQRPAARVSELSDLMCFKADMCVFDRQCPFRRDCLIAEDRDPDG